MSDFAQNGDDVIPRIAGGDPKGLRGERLARWLIGRQIPSGASIGCSGSQNTNPFVTIKGPGSAGGQKSAASGCEVGFEMKAKRAMNKTAERLRDFSCRSMRIGAILFLLLRLLNQSGSSKCLKYLGILVEAAKFGARDPFPRPVR
jgi:hypothetical protein